MSEDGSITLLLRKAGDGDRQAADQLFRLVEQDLKAIAQRLMKRISPSEKMSLTGLVDEAFCRLMAPNGIKRPLGDRKTFFSYAATKIHNLLIDEARTRLAEKRGAKYRHDRPDVLDREADANIDANNDQLVIDLRHALDEFETFAFEDALAFRLKAFLGCTYDEIATILDSQRSEVVRQVSATKVWLQRKLKDYVDDA